MRTAVCAIATRHCGGDQLQSGCCPGGGASVADGRGIAASGDCAPANVGQSDRGGVAGHSLGGREQTFECRRRTVPPGRQVGPTLADASGETRPAPARRGRIRRRESRPAPAGRGRRPDRVGVGIREPIGRLSDRSLPAALDFRPVGSRSMSRRRATAAGRSDRGAAG